MARIELRNTTIYIQDGLSGTCLINEPTTAPQDSDTTVDVDTVSLNTDDADLIPVGARFTVASSSLTYTVTGRTPASSSPTTNIVFTPAWGTGNAPANDDTVTFAPQRLQVKIGDGDLTWTEAREFIYDLDRDLLDTVRQGEEQPLEIDLNFVYDYVTTESGQAITPVDALKRIGEATEWVSSSSDLCEPYAVDIFVVNCQPCGTDQDEELLFSDFRYETLEYSIRDASIGVSGRCNVTDATASRTATGDGCS